MEKNIKDYIVERLESDLRTRILESTVGASEFILESDNSWGEIFENVICEAWNSEGKSLGKYEKTVSKKGLDPDKVCENIYSCLCSVQLLSPGDRLEKLDKSPDVTQEWVELGLYNEKRPNATPKTDIIRNNRGNCRISVKEASGARLMSGAVNETIATIRAAIENSGNTELKDFADSIFAKLTGENVELRARIKGSTTEILKKLKLRENPDEEPEDEDEAKIWRIEQAKNELNALIEKLKDKNAFPGVFDAILKEAITGEVKFGKNSPACADYVLLWDSKGNVDIYTTDDYIQKFGSEYRIYSTYKSSSNKVKGVKDGSRNTWMVMTISQ